MTLRERVLSSDPESEVYCTHLVERLPWAVEDTHPPRGAGSAVPRQRSEDSAEETVACARRAR